MISDVGTFSPRQSSVYRERRDGKWQLLIAIVQIGFAIRTYGPVASRVIYLVGVMCGKDDLVRRGGEKLVMASFFIIMLIAWDICLQIVDLIFHS